MPSESNEEGLTTLAVFDHQSMPIKPAPLNKEKSIKTRSGTKSSPKLGSKVKREPDSRTKFAEVANIKPFSSASGIPKPMAAVKGTAKTVQKADQADLAARERTPGDGKEVCDGGAAVAAPTDAEKPPASAGNLTETAQEDNADATNEGGRLFPSALDDEKHSKQVNCSRNELVAEPALAKHHENEEEESVSVQPMAALFAADDSLKRMPRLSGNFGGPKRSTAFSTEALDGYVSESGASLYARKAARFAINQRNRDCDR